MRWSQIILSVDGIEYYDQSQSECTIFVLKQSNGRQEGNEYLTKRDTKSNLISMVFVDMFTKAYQWLNKGIIDIARNHCNLFLQLVLLDFVHFLFQARCYPTGLAECTDLQRWLIASSFGEKAEARKA